jgi:hypothetical protein
MIKLWLLWRQKSSSLLPPYTMTLKLYPFKMGCSKCHLSFCAGSSFLSLSFVCYFQACVLSFSAFVFLQFIYLVSMYPFFFFLIFLTFLLFFVHVYLLSGYMTLSLSFCTNSVNSISHFMSSSYLFMTVTFFFVSYQRCL